MARCLGRIRLSRLTDESTSAERQRELIEQWAAANGHRIAGWAIDLDVSGSVDPFDTPGLGPWLKPEKSHDWDVLVAWKLDRMGRDAIRLNKLFGWCIDEGKSLVSASEGIDLGTPVGRLIAQVIAFLAEGELEAIRERVRGSHRKLRELGRWPGGKPVYGYTARERTDGPGWELVHDDHAQPVLSGIVDRIIDGASLDSVARDLTDSGELSPSDYLRERAGKPVRGNPWTRQTLVQLLRSKSLLGHVTYDGVTVRDDAGDPILKGSPLIPAERWDRLQSALAERTWTKTHNRTTQASPMLGVALCYCETPLHFRSQSYNDKRYRYYYCPAGHKPQIRAETVEELVEEAFLYELEHENVRERVFVPAESHQTELDEAVRAVDELTALAGTMTSDTVRKRLTAQLSALDSRIAELERLPVRESRWEYRETPETYGQAWNGADTEGRRQLLLRSGITATFKLTGKARGTAGALEFALRVPEDIRSRMSV